MTRPDRAGLGSILIVALAMVSGCAQTPADEAKLISNPEAQPVRNLTNFSESLRRVDTLFSGFGVRGLTIPSQGIPDATGEISTGTKEMLISVDLIIGELRSRQILPWASANNSIAVRRFGSSANIGGTIPKADLGLSFEVALAYNLGLSERRAQSVRNYLMLQYKIEPSRLWPPGPGESQPLPGVAPEDGTNRRVEFHAAS